MEAFEIDEEEDLSGLDSDSSSQTEVPRTRSGPLPPINADEEPGLDAVSGRHSDTQTGQNSRRPRIIQFRRETSEDDQSETSLNERTQSDTKHSKRSVSFAETPLDDRVNVECQTEWSWLQDMKALGKTLPSQEEGSTTESSDEDAEKSKTTKSEEPAEVDEAPKSEEKIEGIAPKPEPFVDDLYGVPMLQVQEGDSDFSDIDDDVAVPAGAALSDEEEEEMVKGIGPPNILQYKRESEERELEVDDPDELTRQLLEQQRQESRDRVQPVDGTKCDHCSESVKPFPTLAMQEKYPPEELFCCDTYREFVHVTLTHPLNQKFYEEEEKISVSPHPPHGNKVDRRAAKERAAAKQRERQIQKQQAQAAAAAAAASGSGGPSGFYAAAHASSRIGDVARQMKTINYQLSSQRCLEEGWTLRVPSPLREDSEHELFELDTEDGDYDEDSRPDKMLDFSDMHLHLNKRKRRKLLVRNYPNGERFLIMFPDGSGNVFYQSGNLAVTIMRSERSRLSYFIHDDTNDRKPNLLGFFEPNGNGACYYQGGAIRLHVNAMNGVEHNSAGGRRRRWKWKEQVDHVHAPPFQPICMALNQCISVRVMSQENIILTFRYKNRSCRFNMGTKLKLIRPDLLPPPELDPNAQYIKNAQNLVESLLIKVNTMLRFPKSTKLEKLKPIEEKTRTPPQSTAAPQSRLTVPGSSPRKMTASSVRVT